MEYVIKRDGSQVTYDKEKIYDAISRADAECEMTGQHYMGYDTICDAVEDIDSRCKNHASDISVEEIQNIVECVLMSYEPDVARAYIRYRYMKEVAREYKADFFEAIGDKLSAKNVVNQNANIDEYSFGGRVGEASDTMMKEYALNFCMSKMARENHLSNQIYIHDLSAYAVGMHNCAARETKFCTTYDGVRSFEDYEDGDRVSVLTHIGNHEMATVKRFGVQKLNKITFSFAGQRFVTERFTSNHRWILDDGTVTNNLKIGDKLAKAPIQIRTNGEFSFDDASEKEKYYWCLGFVLADGTEAYRWSHGKKNEDIKFVRMRLCGDKIKYEPRFAQLKHSTKEMDNGDLYLTFSSTIGFRKEFPDLIQMTRREKHALFDGLYAADGQKAGSRKSILTTDEQIASFIEDEAPALGWFILNVKDKTSEKTNYKTRGFTKEFTFIGDANKYYWTVVDIKEDKEEEVWCLEVENAHSFVLPNGITTGNCLTVPFDHLLEKGFNTRQVDIRPANSVDTAFQLVAVIFQLQSLMQFGGVSASHIDWTMVPYVRKSFHKHWVDGMEYTEDSQNYRESKYYKEHFNKENIPTISIHDTVYMPHIFKNAYRYAMNMTERELAQAAEGLYHNLNSLQSRSGNQLPFTSLNYGTCTLPEGRMVIKALLEGSIKGVGKHHRTPIFPCGIFQVGEGINKHKGDPNYDLFQLALKSTSLRLYPNYANIDWSGNAGYDKNDPKTYFSTMGKCKLQLM